MQRSAEDLDWNDVRLLLALSRARTLGEAGGQLGVDASTVSRRLDALEGALGSKLFERGRAGVAATEAAEELVPVAEEIEAAMARFTGTAAAFEREVAGEVRVACPPDAAEVRIVPLLPELRARHPRLRVHIVPGESLAHVARREVDIALRIVRPEQGDLVVTRVGQIAWTVAASPELARRLGTLRRWEHAPWIGWGEGMQHAPPAQWLARHVPDFDPVLCTDSVRVQIAAAQHGLGAVLLPVPSVEAYGLPPLKLGPKLKRDAAAWPRNDFFMVTHRALRAVPRVRAVWELLLERLSDL